MDQLVGFTNEGKEHITCKLKRSIYGFKQASRQWYLKFNDIIVSCGFKENILYQCINLKVSRSNFILLIMYVDDILLATNDLGLLSETKMFLSNNFEMKDMGEASSVPLQKGDKFCVMQCPKNDLERKQMEDIPYAYVVGNLMYAQICTRPYISFAVDMLGRYQSNLGLEHWKVAKKVLRYLQGTKSHMLT